MEGILRTADGQFDVKLNDFLEEVVQIETKHHNNEMSIRLMKYCDLMQYKPVIEKMVDDRGGKLVEEYDKESYPNEELEEAIDLYAKNLDTKESGISRSFVWALCYPSVISAYISYTNAFWANYTFPKDSKNGEYTYTSIAYKHFCDVLQKHVMYLLSGRFDGCKGAFKFIFRYRLKYNVFEEFIKDEFGTEWIFLSRPLREYKRAKEVFYWENGYEPSAEEMSKYMELSLKVAKQRERDLEVRSGLVFLDEYDRERSSIYECCRFDGKLQENLISREKFENSDIGQMVRMYLAGDHLRIIEYRYGINGNNEPYSVKKISEVMGISYYHVRKKLNEAYDILRPHFAEFLLSEQ